MGQQIKIKIHVSQQESKIRKVKPRCAELCHADGDMVEWKIIDHDKLENEGKEEELTLPFKVKFMELSPFHPKVEFNNTDNESGPITTPPPDATFDQFFRYKIEVDGCAQPVDPVDPGIIIWK